MTNKTDIMRHIEEKTGKNFLSLTEVARYMGIGRDSARRLMSGVPHYNSGRAKLYHVRDVAECIYKKLNF